MSQFDKIREILTHPIPVSIVTVGKEGSHLIGVWNSDIIVVKDESLLIPAGGMRKTEDNIKDGSDIKLLIARREVTGGSGTGIGFRIVGSAEFHYADSYYELIKSRFDWARAALVVTIQKIEQLI
jgi:hypothetical protein